MTRPDIKKVPGARKSKLPSFIPPQIATLVRQDVKTAVIARIPFPPREKE